MVFLYHIFKIGLFIILWNRADSSRKLLSAWGESNRYDFINVVDSGGELFDTLELNKIPIPVTVFNTNCTSRNTSPLMTTLSARLLTVVLASAESNFEIVFELLKFNSLSNIVIVVDSMAIIQPALEKFVRKNYINVIAMLANDDTYFTFDLFPEFVVKSQHFQKPIDFVEKMKNIHRHPIKFSCYNSIPRCIASKSKATGRHIFIGYLSRMARNFSKFINGTFQPTVFNISTANIEANFDVMRRGEIDLISIQKFFIPSDPNEFFIYRQNASTTLGFHKIIIIAPSPQPLHTRFYFIKPFGIKIWLCLVFAVFYSSSLMATTMRLMGVKGDLSHYFCDILRLVTSQTLSFHSMRKMRRLPLFYALNQALGFIVILWYSAILGSFLTTCLYGTTIETFDDLRAANLKVLTPKVDYNLLTLFQGVENNQDIFESVELNELSYRRNRLDRRNAYMEVSDHWVHFAQPQMRYFNDHRFKETKVILAMGTSFMMINHDSVYKQQLNRFIQRVKDVGLFKLWCERVFMEHLQNDIEMELMFKSKENVVNVLEVGFFEYLFIGWAIGLAVGLLTFVAELLWTLFYKKLIFKIMA